MHIVAREHPSILVDLQGQLQVHLIIDSNICILSPAVIDSDTVAHKQNS